MTAEGHVHIQAIRERLRAIPFRPFRIFLSDGSSHDVCHPEFVAVGRRSILVGEPADPVEAPERFAECDPLHITRIELLEGAAGSR